MDRPCPWENVNGINFGEISSVFINNVFMYLLHIQFNSLSVTTMMTKSLQPMQHGRYNYAATTINDKIYAAGGQTEEKSYSQSVECYDPIEDKWSELASMNYPRARFALEELKGNLYAFGHHKSIERYDPVENQWTVVNQYF